MTLADIIRREAQALLRSAATMGHNPQMAEANDVNRRVGVILDHLAGVVEVHGYAGLHGYLAARSYGTPVGMEKRVFEDTVSRILKGGH